MANHDAQKDFLTSTEAIINAGKRLSKALREEVGPDSAVRALERAVADYERDGSHYQQFNFSRLETVPEKEKATREKLTEDVLATVLLDLQVANVLMAAGSAVGESDEKAAPDNLEEELNRLANTRRSIAHSLTGATAGRFGFITSAVCEPFQSPDLPAAINTFRVKVERVLKTFVDEAGAVMNSGIMAISKLDRSQAFSGLQRLGEFHESLQGFGRLFRFGIKKMNEAVDTLIRLFGSDAFKQVKEKVTELWGEAIKDRKHVSRVLTLFFGLKATQEMSEKETSLSGLDRSILDQASSEIAELDLKFKENMVIASDLVTAVTYGSMLLAYTPLAGPGLVLFTASTCFVILAAVVLIGMDYADSYDILRRVRGVREIVSSVRPVS